jgi:hypothetical protein
MTMYAIHIGVGPRSVQAVLRIARAAGVVSFVDGDGWNAWGEGVGQAGNDQRTLHVVLEAAGPTEAEVLLSRLGAVSMVAMDGGQQTGVRSVITDMDDWGAYDGVEGNVRVGY